MASHVLDSSVWIALFVDNDPHHAQARRFFRELSGAVYVPYVVVSEVATVITYKHSKVQAEQFFKFLEDNPGIIHLEAETTADVEHFRSIQSKISFADATLLRIARELGVELVTFDKQLARLARKQSR